jgi:cold shock CspA family protein/ribosome-associated translation inhibitor RaiA
MQIPLEVAYRHVRPNAATDALIRREASGLHKYYRWITSCRVHVELPHRHRREGAPHDVRIDLTVPGREIVVSRHHRHDERLADLDFAVREAFRAARRMLEEYVRERRGLVKDHAEPAHGRVTKFFPESGYGFVETADGEEVYFDVRSVLEGGERIERGTELRFLVERAEKGLNATSVRVVGRHHHLAPVRSPGTLRRRRTATKRRPARAPR